MKPAPFTYHRAHTVAEGVSLLNELGENAKVLAGGQSLIPMMNFRLARPEHLVDITHIPMLSEIEYSGEDMRIGSLVTHRAIETFDAKMPGSNIALLRAAMKFVGHYPIRTRGTIGGSIAHADATAEWCILAILLEAEISVVGTRGRRIIPAADMFYGLYTTALAPDEIITHVSFPRHPGAGVIVEHAERQGDFALAAVAAVVEYHDGIVTSGRVVVAGGGPVARRIFEAEALLNQGEIASESLVNEVAAICASVVEPTGDSNGSEAYRRTIIQQLVIKAMKEVTAHEYQR